jgi:hypothetical protein
MERTNSPKVNVITQLTFDHKDENLIVWQGQIVMSRSEQPYFEKLIGSISKKLHPVNVLEIGFGLGISADLIQRNLCPAMHLIVEIDAAIGEDLARFALGHRSVKAVLGDWREVRLDGPYDLIFYDPFDYTEVDKNRAHEEAELLRNLAGTSGVLCHPHFGDGEPRSLAGFRSVVLERFNVPKISMADRTFCEHCALVLCYPLD